MKVLLISCLALLLQGLSLPQAMAAPFPHGDGTLRLFNYHLNEFAEVQFRKGENYDPKALERINTLLRSRDQGGQITIATPLLDLIDHLQDHFGADTVEIISGYRSKEFNAALLKEGHSVSPISLHTQGQALDIHLDEIREETLRDYLLRLGLGGVGYYGPLDFVHVDTGPPRRWGEGADNPKKRIGVLQPQAPIQLSSDKNEYLPGESLLFRWEMPDPAAASIEQVRLELFRRGQWLPCPQLSLPVKAELPQLPASDLRCDCRFPPQGPLPTDGRIGPPASTRDCEGPGTTASLYGKFRWTFRVKGENVLYSSNEFYLKKQ
ncbi:MAG TPA: hypothetical protein DF383_01340 [Deltaproteobacteria bacterium]|nr:hypothetical protein [Deltaproteobacteria bacterium]